MTFVFTDIEGSTRLWERYPELMPGVLERIIGWSGSYRGCGRGGVQDRG